MDFKAKLQLGETEHKSHVPKHDKYFSEVKYVSVASGACSTRKTQDFESVNLDMGAGVAKEGITELCWNAW